MMFGYTFLATLLPPLRIGDLPDMPFKELEFFLQQNLSPIDMAKVQTIRRYYDLQNLRALWLEEPLDVHANFDENQLEEALLTRTGFPEYLYKFLDKYESREERLKFFPELERDYFVEEIRHATGLLRDYLVMERELRLIFTGFRAKRLKRDLSTELQFEDPEDELVGQIMAFRDAEYFEPPPDYSDLKRIFEIYRDDPLGLHQALCQYRFNRLDEFVGDRTMSIDAILAYVIQLILVEKWLELDQQKGQIIVDRIIKEVS